MIGILYFSSTGNSLYIAQKVKKKFEGQIKYIPTYCNDGSEFEKIILVTPIYSYGMPSFTCDLLPHLAKQKEIIVIQNYGGMIGGANYFMYQYCIKCGLNIKAVYTVKMPENFTLTFTAPSFYVRSTLKKADKRIDEILDKIAASKYELPKKCKAKEETYFKNKANWHIIGENFQVSDNCIKCKKCVSICPTKNIVIINDKITFSDKCVACLGCYHRCPQKAIMYLGKKKKDRYINPNIDENKIGTDL